MKYLYMATLLCFTYPTTPSLRNRKKISVPLKNDQENFKRKRNPHQLIPAFSLHNVEDACLQSTNCCLKKTNAANSAMTVFCIFCGPCTTGISAHSAIACGALFLGAACIGAACQGYIEEEIHDRDL